MSLIRFCLKSISKLVVGMFFFEKKNQKAFLPIGFVLSRRKFSSISNEILGLPKKILLRKQAFAEYFIVQTTKTKTLF